MIDVLESRTHLSATVSGNVLTIIGTDRGDNIAIAAGKRSFVVHVNGEQTSLVNDRVKLVRVHGMRGDDSIIVSPRFGVRCSIEAGAGNDRVGGGARSDTILGQAGNDTLAGNDGDDYLDAGVGDDYSEDLLGANVFHGGGGFDRARVYADAIGTGTERIRDALDGTSAEFTTTLRTVGERLLLRYAGSCNGSRAEHTELERRADGHYEVSTAFIDRLQGETFDEFDHEWDVSAARSDGLIFSWRIVPPFPEFRSSFSLVFLLPGR